MTIEASPSLEQLLDSAAAAYVGDEPTEDAPVEAAVDAPVVELADGEQAEIQVPAKLSDLVGQVSTETPTTPTVDLAQRVALPDGSEATLQELWDGRMMRKDYTQKTQELSEERGRLSAAEELYKMLQEDPAGTVRALADNLKVVDDDLGYSPQPVGRKTKDVSKVLGQDDKIVKLVEEKAKQLFEEWRANDPVLQEQEVFASQRKVTAELDRISKAHEFEMDEADRNAVLQIAVQTGETNLEYLVLKMRAMLELKAREAERIRSARTNRSVGTPTPNSQTAQKAVIKTIEDAYQAAQLIEANR